MSRIKSFICNEWINILIWIRHSGKSVILDLIHEEFILSGICNEQFIFINFEDMSHAHLITATTLNSINQQNSNNCSLI